MVKLIKKLWNIVGDMWDHHNEALHSSDSYCNEILESKINNQIWVTFNQGLQALLQDSLALFQGLVKDLLQHSRSYKEQWLESIQAAINKNNTMNMAHIYQNNVACDVGWGWNSPIHEADSA